MPSHRLDTPTSPPARRGALIALTTGAFVAATALAVAMSGQSPTAPPSPANGPSTVSAEAAHHVDVAVAHTLVAATRLTLFERAKPRRRTVILSRAQTDVETALDALGQADLPGAGAEVDPARDHLAGLSTILSELVLCEAATQRRAKPSPGGGCSVSSDEVATARTAGTSMAALVPYGTLTPERLAELSRDVLAQVRAEVSAAAASQVTVTLPEDLTA